MLKVGGYDLVEDNGLHFLIKDRRIVSTIIDMGDGVWRARTREGDARTLTVPADVEEPAAYVAEQIT